MLKIYHSYIQLCKKIGINKNVADKDIYKLYIVSRLTNLPLTLKFIELDTLCKKIYEIWLEKTCSIDIIVDIMFNMVLYGKKTYNEVINDFESEDTEILKNRWTNQ